MNKVIISFSIVSLIFCSCQTKKEEDETFHAVDSGESSKILKKKSVENPTASITQQLPKMAENFIQNHFSDETIQSVIKERDSSGDEYKVQLSRGIQLEFDVNGEWKEVKSVMVNQSIVTSFIPDSITQYLTQNYSNLDLKSVEKDHKGYSIEFFQHDFEVKFDLNGNFLRVED